MFVHGAKKLGMIVLCVVVVYVMAACGNDTEKDGAEHASDGIGGTIIIDGSSTVYPISQAVAEEFMKANKGVSVVVSASGTGGGFKKLANGEIDIAGASRPQKKEEKEAAEKNNIRGVEFKVAYDGVTVVVNKENNWATDMTTEELKKLWEPDAEGKVMKWSDIRADWPDEEIHLYGPGTDSGTFGYFTEAIVGEEGASRADYQPSEDDYVIVQGVENDPYALGYFGYAYYLENSNALNAVSINGVAPTAETIENGAYAPLSRPIFIYVREDRLGDEAVQKYLEFLFNNGVDLIKDVGYIPLDGESYEDNMKRMGREK